MPPIRPGIDGRHEWSICYLRYEDDSGPYCSKCRSSQVWPWGLLGKLFRVTPKGCIQPECDNYWRKPRAPEVGTIAAEVARTENSALPEKRER